MTMEVDANTPDLTRWSNLLKVLARKGPFNHPSFEPSVDKVAFLQQNCRVLVVGGGGLGCELLKNLALMGFGQLEVIDMDTIDISNLNRQFLFRPSDVGKPKAVAAADFIRKRIPGTEVVAHNCKIQDKDEAFYKRFTIVVCGLDSIVARRWINGMLISLLEYDDDGNLDQTSLIPLIDGGTEGFKGNARVILPGLTACVDCTLDLFPPQVNFPLCTLAHTPRLPEHCVEYVRILQWPKENPFGGEEVGIDGDDPAHINWIYERSLERAAQYNISGVTHRLTQGVVKRIIPAVASTNAVIASVCALEVFKMATSCADPLNNYMVYNDSEGIYTYAYEAEKNPDCLACGQSVHVIKMKPSARLQDFVEKLVNGATYQMKNPGVTTTMNGKNKTLYMPNVASIEAATRPNLKKTLTELGLQSGSELVVADSTTPIAVIFKLIFEEEEKKAS